MWPTAANPDAFFPLSACTASRRLHGKTKILPLLQVNPTLNLVVSRA